MTKITTSTIQIKGLIDRLLQIRTEAKEEIKEKLRNNNINKAFYMLDNLGINMNDKQLLTYINQWFMVT